MADVAQPCFCSPYTNICCCGAQNGVSVVQPTCQNLPDGTVVTNPAFVPSLNKSFWTYKFITDCSQATRAISNFVIPICQLIIAENIVVNEKIDGCGTFQPVPFTLSTTDPNFGTAPEGFQFLKIETSDRYEKGVSVEYRLEIVGDFPTASQPISVKAANDIYSFACDGCFLVPECNPVGTLSVDKTCSSTIINNQGTLQYSVHVNNIGNAALNNVSFQDTIFIPNQLSIGQITVNPPTLNVNTSILGEVIISGNLGTINPGEHLLITYSIPIAQVSVPGSYLINNTVVVSATGTTDFSSCQTTINVVRLSADKCCSIEGTRATYTLTVSSVNASPDILVDIYDRMNVPSGITIQFSNLSGCEGYFSGTTNPVPTNTNITGPVSFDFICRNALIPSGGSYQKLGSYTLVSSSVVGISTITNSIIDIVPVNPSDQIFLGTLNLPASADIDVQLIQVCKKQCSTSI